MDTPDLSRARYRKSSRSSANGQCVEVADNIPGLVAVRDSKDQAGPALVLATAGWRCFVAGIKAGTFDQG